jgi:hypothetical protein
MKILKKSMKIPNPGTNQAADMGCTCPVMDNHYGKGFEMGGKLCFWIQEGCPLHNLPKRKNNESHARV